MPHTIEFDAQIANLTYTLNQLRNGANAVRFGHTMSVEDKNVFAASREIVKHLLAKQFDNASDDELITGMENYVQTFMETKNARNHQQ